MYSPGSLKYALVFASRKRFASPLFIRRISSVSYVTSPGPRCLCQETRMSAGGVFPRPPPPPPAGPRPVITWPPIIATDGSGPRPLPRAASPSPRPRPAPRPASDPLLLAGLSAAQNLSSTGFHGEPVRFAAIPRGGPVIVGPFSANFMTGGSFSFAVFLKKSTQYGGFNQKLTVEVWPFAVMVQVSFLVPKSLGTWMANTPYLRPVSKCVGWP